MDGVKAAETRQQLSAPSDTISLFDGGGQMGELMRSIDWSRTPVGPVDSWPQSLKTALSVLLKQRTAVFIFWGPEHVQFYNDAYRPILGTKKHPAAMGQRGADCWPEIWDVILPLVEAVHSGESTAVEDGLLVIDRNGYLEEGYYTYTYSPIADESGKVGGVFCVVYDTTARIIGERRLRTLRDLASRQIASDPEEACRAAAANLSGNPYDVPFAALYLYDESRKTARLAGVTGIEPGASISPLELSFEGNDRPLIAEAAALSRIVELTDLPQRLGPLPGGAWPVGTESGIVLPLTLPGQFPQVGFMVAGVSPRKRLDVSSRTFFELVAGQIGTAIAEAKAYEQERKRAEALAELDRVKTVFFSNVSHEFRTPLTLMLGPLSDLLSKQGVFVDDCREDLYLAHRNALRLLKLVNTLLDFSRIEAGRIQARYEATDLGTLTSDLASVFRSAIDKAGLRLTIECSPLPKPVFVDPEMWEKVILNLLSNAFKFTLTGEIAVRVYPSGDYVEVSVRDTGVGIPESEMAHVFDRFHRIEGNRGRSQEGSGIGLALVLELVKLHGGTISVESVLGQGSTFTIKLPFGSSHLPADRINASRTQLSTATGAQAYVEEALRWLHETPAASSFHDQTAADTAIGGHSAETALHRKARVLIADDNADMRDYLRRRLTDRYDILAVAAGDVALEAIQQNPPDLLLADVMMPGLDGFRLLQLIRSDPSLKTLPVILLSARAGEESRVEGLRAGADDYVVKPFSARELLVRISSRLEIARLRKEAWDAELRLLAEAESERQKLRDLIENAPAAVAVLYGPDHTFQLVNRAYAMAVGRAEESLIGKPVVEALPEIRGQVFPQLLDRVYRSGEPFVGTEMRAQLDRGGDGLLEDRYFNFVYQPWHDPGRKIQGVFVHAVDITEQVVARKHVEQAMGELQRAYQDMETFAYSASHDLQEPIRNIAIYTQLLQRDFGDLLKGEPATLLDGILAGVLRMDTLVKDLLEFSRATKTMEGVPQRISASEVLQTVLSALKNKIQESAAEVTYDELPTVWMHEVHLTLLLQNLVGNALKYRKENEAPRVQIRAIHGDAEWTFSVEDNGIGIEPKYHTTVFGLFSRLHSKDLYPGSGIGLAICQRIVQRYGGRIWVESVPGRGTTFFFTIPESSTGVAGPRANFLG
jgi:PAS domain S-box-containing protein